MPLDAICLAAVGEEVSRLIIGSKIDKIQQPERDMLVFSLRTLTGSCRLLVSAGSGDKRVHITEHRFDNPAAPPMYCMLLRKHLTGARITGVTQPRAERVLELELDARDAMGVSSKKTLIVELIGRLSNVILTDADGLIIDCLRRIGGELTDRRVVLPGLIYRGPPAQEGKADPTAVDEDAWPALYDTAVLSSGDKPVCNWLLSAFSAMSPLICRELTWRAYRNVDIRFEETGDNGEALRREFFKLTSLAGQGRFEPWMVYDGDGAPLDFSYTEIMQYEGLLAVTPEKSFSEMLDRFYTHSSLLARIRQRASATAKTVKTARDRIIRKLAAQQAELSRTEDRNLSRECGDIIMSNLHLMKKGQKTLTAPDYFSDDGGSRQITLDPLKTPQQNAAKYYKDYTKQKNAEGFLSEQIRIGQSELTYLESVLEEITLVENERDISEIRRELIQTGYIKAQKKTPDKTAETAPMRFESSTGFRIAAGRNNLQNDKLTLKTASRFDVWLHAQKIHGAHVILSCDEKGPDEASLLEAAAIAAYYSAARSGGKVPIDYTLARYVKKPQGARPGMVVYTDYKTLVVTPDEKLISRLRKVTEKK